MSVIKIEALKRLEEVISCNIKDLKGKICAGPANRNHRLSFPHLALVPERFSFFPDQRSSRDPVTGEDRDIGAKDTIYNVGRWEGTIKLTLGAKTAFRRYELEWLLEKLFLDGTSGTLPSRPDAYADLRPGVLLVDIPNCHNARVAFELEDDTWENEKVFSNEWYSVMRITAQIPALVPFKVDTIETLELVLTEDLETVATPTSLPPDSETVVINEDGTIN